MVFTDLQDLAASMNDATDADKVGDMDSALKDMAGMHRSSIVGQCGASLCNLACADGIEAYQV